MSDQLNIVCPHCGFSRTVPKSVVPDGARRVTCPKCKQSFPLNGESMRPHTEPHAPAPVMTAAPPPLSTNSEVGAPPPQPPPPPKPAPRPAPRNLKFSFNGTARDYFGIWIVNILLKIVTVGFYSAWAKVRRRRFFFGSTTLQGQPFEYMADPFVLFKGWLIAALAFILYSIGTKISPALSGVIALVVFIAFPWLLVRSRMFNASNSSYRNIRFGFRPDYSQAYLVFLGLPIISVLSLGLMSPYMLYRQKKFMVEQSSYGATPFSFTATIKDFYILFAKVALGFIVVFGLIGAGFVLTGSGLASAAASGGKISTLRGLALVPALALPLVYFILVVYVQTAMANLSWNGTRLGKGSFRSTLRTRDMALLFVTNALAILFSLGLMVPWATVRLACYRFKRLELEAAAGLDEVVAAAGSGVNVGAVGDEIGDVFDMPIEIAL